jgi:hypothetical protein
MKTAVIETAPGVTEFARTLHDLTRDIRFKNVRLIRGGGDPVALVPTLDDLSTHPERFDTLPLGTQAALYGVVAALEARLRARLLTQHAPRLPRRSPMPIAG